jgi:hypothetical protein
VAQGEDPEFKPQHSQKKKRFWVQFIVPLQGKKRKMRPGIKVTLKKKKTVSIWVGRHTFSKHWSRSRKKTMKEKDYLTTKKCKACRQKTTT